MSQCPAASSYPRAPPSRCVPGAASARVRRPGSRQLLARAAGCAMPCSGACLVSPVLLTARRAPPSRPLPGGCCARGRVPGDHRDDRPGGGAPAAALGTGGWPRLQGRLAPAGRRRAARGHAAVQGPRTANALQVRGGGAKLRGHARRQRLPRPHCSRYCHEERSPARPACGPWSAWRRTCTARSPHPLPRPAGSQGSSVVIRLPPDEASDVLNFVLKDDATDTWWGAGKGEGPPGPWEGPVLGVARGPVMVGAPTSGAG